MAVRLHPLRAGFLTIVTALLITALPGLAGAQNDEATAPITHAIHMFDEEPLYPADFPHWNYVNPDAPRGGRVILGSRGSYDTLNDMNAKGDPAPGLTGLYNSLLTGNSDETDTSYGELAETIQMPKDRTWVIFKIRDEAKWADGVPVTPKDVIFTWERNREQGFPGFTQAYADVTNIEDLGDNRVKFTFNPEAGNRELPDTVGGEAIIPEHYWRDRDFSKTTMEPPLGSGAYKIGKFKRGQFIEYDLRDDYWAKDLPFNKGVNNYGTLRYDMYRETTIIRKALKAGKIDYRAENQAKAWATEYTDMDEAKEAGVFHQALIEDKTIQAAQAFFFNVQLPKFQNRDVRHAIALAFDFEWTNKALFFDQYTRTQSHFQNSFLQATGKPEGEVLEILEGLREDGVPEEVFGEAYTYPVNDGSGNNRGALRTALGLFKKAGYSLKDGKLVDKDGVQLSMEFASRDPEGSRYVNPWIENLRKIGVDANNRLFEPNQWLEKVRERDFESTGYVYAYSYTPGTQVDYYWSSRLAQTKGSIAFHGVINPALDKLIAEMLETRDRNRLNSLALALDRILTHEHYMVLQWHIPFERLVFWDKFGKPDTPPKFGSGAFSTWWIDPEKEATLVDRQQGKTVETAE